jgi:UDPglucose 6-dehydrogenase
MNELANLADALGVDIEQVRKGIGADPRIGYGFLYAGVGYGGSCFPKDVQALVHTAGEHGQRLRILEAVRAVNDAQKRVLVDKVVNRFGSALHGRTFALWGLSFKPNTDDMREAPSRVMIKALIEHGARVVAYDPIAIPEAKRALALDLGSSALGDSRVLYADHADAGRAGCGRTDHHDEWKTFKSPNCRAESAKRQPVGGRNLPDPAIRNQGWAFAIGR